MLNILTALHGFITDSSRHALLADGSTSLSGLMRTATTDERARRWFRRYWTFGVGSGAHVLVHALLESVRDTAEQAQQGGESDAPASPASIQNSLCSPLAAAAFAGGVRGRPRQPRSCSRFASASMRSRRV